MRVLLIQPTYLPWSGYFGMIDKADLFIVYNDVQFVKHSWHQRNRIKTSSGMKWLTVPIQHGFGQNISDTKVDNKMRWCKKHRKTITYSYSKSPYFNNNFVDDIYNKNWDLLLDLNLYIIKQVMKFLSIKTKITLSSELSSKGTKTDRIIDILAQVDADEYITQQGTKDYLDLEKFKENNIKLQWFNFEHPVYSQLHGDFVPYMSVIDMLFNCGGKNSISMIREASSLEDNV